MACYTPLHGWRGLGGRLVFSRNLSPLQVPMTTACGQCIGCRSSRSKAWAIRVMHEASLWDYNCFITLTYCDEDLPYPPTLRHRDFQLFMKRLRRWAGAGVRFYMCGEYGDDFGRPHFHAILFNCDFPDKKLWKVRRGNRTYISEKLASLWPFGFHEIGDVTYKSAAYVARYVMKKINGKRASEHYSWVDPSTGEIFLRAPEYARQSLKPGIAAGWIERFFSDVFPRDYVVFDSFKHRPPRYYDKFFEELNPKAFLALKRARKRTAKLDVDNTTPERLAVRAACAAAKLSRLKRELV